MLTWAHRSPTASPGWQYELSALSIIILRKSFSDMDEGSYRTQWKIHEYMQILLVLSESDRTIYHILLYNAGSNTFTSSFLLYSCIFCRKLSGSTPLYWYGRKTPVTGSGPVMSCLAYLQKHSEKSQISMLDVNMFIEITQKYKPWFLYDSFPVPINQLFPIGTPPYLSFSDSSRPCQLSMVAEAPKLLPALSSVLLSRSWFSAYSLENSRNAEHLFPLFWFNLFHFFIWQNYI